MDELEAIVEAERRTGLVYMMMKTAVYTHHCLCPQSLYDSGDCGRIQFMRDAHYQDMDGWPEYWQGLPPMHYATHAVSPLLAMELTRSLFATARGYLESFNIYGENCSFEWPMESELPVLFRRSSELGNHGRGRIISHQRVTPPETSKLLPREIRRHSRHQVVPDPDNSHLSLLQGGGHHDSHPHLVHEFVRSIIERRRSRVDSVTAAHWTAPGLADPTVVLVRTTVRVAPR